MEATPPKLAEANLDPETVALSCPAAALMEVSVSLDNRRRESYSHPVRKVASGARGEGVVEYRARVGAE